MNNITKWAIIANVITCVFVGVAFIITESPWAFVLLATLTIVKDKYRSNEQNNIR